MRINIVSPVFPPEPITSARANADLAEQLCKNGHQVRVITAFPNRPAGKLYDGYKRKLLFHDSSFSGYDVLRCFSMLSSKSTMLSRFMENISFGIMSAMAVLLLEKPDVIYGHTWPIFAQGILAIVCRLRGVPFTTRVQDLYPESLFVQGRIANRSAKLYKVLRWLDMKIKNSSVAVIVISEAFRRIHVQDRKLPMENVHLIPNWIDEDFVQINPIQNNIRRSHDIPEDAFLVVYGGNVGAAAGVETVIAAFQNLVTNPNIYFLVAGEGALLARCRELAQRVKSPRILFHSPWPQSETSTVLAAASILVLPTQGDQSIVSVPSKLMTYMLAARPVLSCVPEESDIARIITDAACGWIIPPGNPELLSQQILFLSQQPLSQLVNLGNRGRSYVLQHMTRKANLAKLVDLIESIRP